MVEGDADVLIDKGVVQTTRLKKELITNGELISAAHKQGFGSLDEVERAILEPGGTICFFGKEPSLDMQRHRELLAQIAAVSAQVSALR